jgi:polyisoprenyl-phosphate glycosyltransferase
MDPIENSIIDYSLVMPAFNEEGNLVPLLKRIEKVMSEIPCSYEVILVNNGSNDSTPFILEKLLKVYPKLVVLTLTRNFGYEGAIIAGLENSRGQKVIIMDGDQQDPPEILPEFISKSDEGFDIVYGIRSKRTEGLFVSIQIKIFYRMMKKIVDFNLPKDAGNFSIMTREVVDIINGMPERNKFIRGLRAWSGLSSAGLVYTRDDRTYGQSKFSFFSYFNHAINGITSFSTAPLRLFTYMGVLGVAISLLAASFFFVSKLAEVLGLDLLNYKIPSGSTTLAIILLAGISLNLLGFGVLGEYIGRIFDEVKSRPRYLIRKIAYGEKMKSIDENSP